MIYLDYNATAPIRPQVVEKMREVMARPANASSVHGFGRKAKNWIEDVRGILAATLNCWPNEIVFTASGTEANNMALHALPNSIVLCSAIEHPSVLRVVEYLNCPHPNPSLKGEGVHNPSPSGRGWGAAPGEGEWIIPVDANGVVDLEELEKTLYHFKHQALSTKHRLLLSLMLANNETGIIQPVLEAVKIAKRYGAKIHTDATQALGKMKVDFSALGVDMMTVSAHKMGGPQGVAALIVRSDLPIQPLLLGGGQELRRRAGTENIAAIAGFGMAMELMDLDYMKKMRFWLDQMEMELISHPSPPACGRGVQEGTIYGKSASRLPNTSCIRMPGVSNETQLMAFDLEGFAVSAGSACSSGRIEMSHVLKAMGIAENEASQAIRVSGGWNTCEDDIKRFTEAWKSLFSRTRKNRPANAPSSGQAA